MLKKTSSSPKESSKTNKNLKLLSNKYKYTGSYIFFHYFLLKNFLSFLPSFPLSLLSFPSSLSSITVIFCVLGSVPGTEDGVGSRSRPVAALRSSQCREGKRQRADGHTVTTGMLSTRASIRAPTPRGVTSKATKTSPSRRLCGFCPMSFHISL